MIPKDLYKKIRRIEITTNRLVTDIFAGQYHSVFKGRGMEFSEVREYQMGDDVRTIDWNVTARTGNVHVKKFVEERELTIMLLVDVSASCQFATVNELKSKLAAEIAAVLTFSAIRNNDKVGLIIFTDRIEKYIPARKGLSHALRIIRELLYSSPKGKATDLAGALDFLNRISKRRSVAFAISDFLEPSQSRPLKKALAIANKRHDLIAVTLNDPREEELTDCGLVNLQDPESGEVFLVDSSDPHLRKEYRAQALKRLHERERLFRSAGMDHMNIFTHIPYTKEMVKFFMQRWSKIK